MVADFIPPISSAERDAKSPVSEALMQKIDLALELLQDAIASNGLGLLAGTADADPPNTTNSYVEDANPTVGTIDRDDKFNDLYLKITSGTASGNRYRITDTIASTKRIQVAENLYAAGVRSGDSYKIIGHRHTGIDSEKVAYTDLDGIAGVQSQGGVIVRAHANTQGAGARIWRAFQAEALDTTLANYMRLTATTNLDIDTSGANGRGTSTSLSANTNYAVYEIKKSSDGTTALLADTNFTTPGLPTGYDLYRKISWFRTDGSSNIHPCVVHNERISFFLGSAIPDESLSSTNTDVNLNIPSDADEVVLFVRMTAGKVEIHGYNATGQDFEFDFAKNPEGLAIIPIHDKAQIKYRNNNLGSAAGSIRLFEVWNDFSL